MKTCHVQKTLNPKPYKPHPSVRDRTQLHTPFSPVFSRRDPHTRAFEIRTGFGGIFYGNYMRDCKNDLYLFVWASS